MIIWIVCILYPILPDSPGEGDLLLRGGYRWSGSTLIQMDLSPVKMWVEDQTDVIDDGVKERTEAVSEDLRQGELIRNVAVSGSIFIQDIVPFCADLPPPLILT